MSSFTLTNPETPGSKAPGPKTPASEDQGSASSGPADDFAVLEQRVLRTVQLLKSEREARAAAEGTAKAVQQLLDEQSARLAEAEGKLRALEQEREQVRGRVERMMKELDDVGG